MSTVLLQFDLGNTRAKWRLIAGGHTLVRGSGPDPLSTEPDWRAITEAPAAVQVASVAGASSEESLRAAVLEHFGLPAWFARSSASVGRLRSAYLEPERLGVDRWLAMLAATERCHGSLCVIDAGSALTIDLVDAAGVHIGGFILPGAALMERALLQDTQRVRFQTPLAVSLSPGNSTDSCACNGVALAQVGAVRLALARAGAGTAQPTVFLCGGGAASLQPLLDIPALNPVPDLVFEGLGLLAQFEATAPAQHAPQGASRLQ